MIFVFIPLLVMVNVAVNYYPPLFFARLTGGRGKYFFIVPAIMGLPVYLTRLVMPFVTITVREDYDYLALCILSDNIFGAAQIVAMLTVCKYFSRTRLVASARDPKWSLDLATPGVVFALRVIGYLFLVAGVSSIIVLAIVSDYGVYNWIISARTGYQEYRRGNGQYWVLAQVMLSLSTFILARLSRSRTELLFNLLLLAAAWWFLGSKAFLIGLGGFGIAMWFYKFGVSLTVLGLSTAFVFGLMYANWFLAAQVSQYSMMLKDVLWYFDMYPLGMMYYRDYFNGQIELFHGKVFLSSFWAYVPRALYPDKPWVFGVVNIVEHFMPGSAEAGHTPGFAGSVEHFADFGYVGLLIAPLLDLTFVLKTTLTIVVCRSMATRRWNDGELFLLSVIVLSPNWTQFTGGVYFIFLIVALLILSGVIRLFRTGGMTSPTKPTSFTPRRRHQRTC